MTKSMQTPFEAKLIKSEKEYNRALDRLELIFDAKPKSKEGKEAELLALLIDEYEKENYPIETPDPIEAIKIRMEELEIKQKDLVGIIGNKSIVSEVLNRKRRLTVQMIRSLSDKLNLTAKLLVQDYNLKKR